MFAEDLDVFLQDFGVVCTSGGVTFQGLLDEADRLVQMQRVNVSAREYELTFITDAVVLRREQTLTVAGKAYTVRQAPQQIDDGAFSTVLISPA